MEVETDHVAWFREREDCKSSPLVFDVTVANPPSPTVLVHAGTRAGYPIAEAVRSKETKHGGIYLRRHELIPLAFSARGKHSFTIQDLVKELWAQ